MRCLAGSFVRHLIAMIAMLVAVAAALVMSPAAVSAQPVDCAAVAARINAHNQAADFHNANPPDPSNSAAVAAYNAEAQRANAEIPELQALAAQCRDQGEDVPPVGAPPQPDQPQPCPVALIVPVTGTIAEPPACVPPPAPAPSPQAPPPPANQRNVRPAVPANVLPPLSRAIPGAPTAPYQPWQLAGPKPSGTPAPLPPSLGANPGVKVVPAAPVPAPGQANPSAAVPNVSETFANFLPYAMQNAAPLTQVPPGSYGIPNTDGYDPAANSTPVVDAYPGGGFIAYGPTDGVYGASGVFMRIVPGMKNQGSAANRALLPGLPEDRDPGHLAGRVSGGSGRIVQNLVDQNRLNNRGAKAQWDALVTNAAEGLLEGVEPQAVYAIVAPIWGEPGQPPTALMLWAWGDKGFYLDPIIIDNA